MDEENDKKNLWFYQLRDKFDLRYIRKGGTQALVNTIVFGCCGLILTSFIVGLVAFAFHVKASL